MTKNKNTLSKYIHIYFFNIGIKHGTPYLSSISPRHSQDTKWDAFSTMLSKKEGCKKVLGRPGLSSVVSMLESAWLKTKSLEHVVASLCCRFHFFVILLGVLCVYVCVLCVASKNHSFADKSRLFLNVLVLFKITLEGLTRWLTHWLLFQRLGINFQHPHGSSHSCLQLQVQCTWHPSCRQSSSAH